MTRQDINILMDDRERHSGIGDILASFPAVAVREARLEVGDYEVDGRLLVERKSLHDFGRSLIDGRLFRQGCRLAEAPLRGLMILEGWANELATMGIRREALQGAMVTLSVFLGIPILRACDPGETARLMIYTARQAGAFAHGALPRQGKRPTGKRGNQLYLLQGLPGVGPERARLLLERFGSVEAVLTANQEALMTVDGIGSTTAERIRWLVREEIATYSAETGEISITHAPCA